MEPAGPSEVDREKSSNEGLPLVGKKNSQSIPNNQLATYLLESLSNPGQSRHEGIVTFLTKVLGDGAKWYNYEIFKDESFTIDINHRSGEKWTRFLESFLRQCVRLAGVKADLSVEGKHLNLVFREYYDVSRLSSQSFSVRPREDSRREVAFK